MNAKLNRYTIQLSQKDFDSMIVAWSWLVPTVLKPEMLTKFGDWFLSDNKSNLYFLDALEGTLKCIGDTIQDCCIDDFLERHRDQFSIDWIELCVSKGLTPAEGQCYGWKLHPIMGGPLTYANIGIFGTRVYQYINAQLHQQLRAHVEGKEVTGFTVTQNQPK